MRKIFIEIAMLSGLVPFSIFITNRQKLQALKYVVPLIALIAFGGIYELIFTLTLHFETDIWWRIYSILEPAAFFYFFYRLFNGKYRLFLNILGIVGFLLATWLSLDFAHTKGMDGDSYLSMYACVLVFLMSILWFKDLFLNITPVSILDLPAFYFIAGMILYLAGTIFTNILGDLLQNVEKDNFPYYWLTVPIMCLIFRIFLVLGLCKALPK